MNNNSMNLIKQVSLLPLGTIKDINDEDIEGYIKSEGGSYYVGIPFPNPENKRFIDSFVGFKLESGMIRLANGEIITGLYLFACDEIELDKFAYVGYDFLLKANRSGICENPYSWSDKWRQIFGDSMSKDKPAAILGELLVLMEVYKRDKTAVWVGSERGSQDISCKEYDVEVKTTTLKKDTKITINSAIQLGGRKRQELYFVRLENKPHGITIDKAVSTLVELGYDLNSLETSLNLQGYPRGSRVRQIIGFDLIEIKAFDVNEENFPLISLTELNQQSSSQNIIDYTLTIDLTNKPFERVFEKKKEE